MALAFDLDGPPLLELERLSQPLVRAVRRPSVGVRASQVLARHPDRQIELGITVKICRSDCRTEPVIGLRTIEDMGLILFDRRGAGISA